MAIAILSADKMSIFQMLNFEKMGYALLYQAKLEHAPPTEFLNTPLEIFPRNVSFGLNQFYGNISSSIVSLTI